MQDLVRCLVDAHDPYLLGTALGLALIAGSVSVRLFRRAGRDRRRLARWVLPAGATAGTGIWSAHFVAMLGFGPSTGLFHDPGVIALSLALILSASMLAFVIAAEPGRGRSTALGGLILGGAIFAMHYIGMSGVAFPGRLSWPPASVGLAALVAVPAGIGTVLAMARPGVPNVGVVALYTVAALGTHAVAMAGVTAVADPLVAVSRFALPAWEMAVLVGAVLVVVIGFGAAGLLGDDQVAALREEAEHIRELADAAMEGIVVLERDRIVEINKAFELLVGLPRDRLIGSELADVLGDDDAIGATRPNRGAIRAADGVAIPVELHRRDLTWNTGSRTVVAVRDLREQLAAERRIAFLAQYDPLTDLRNRSTLPETMARWIRARTADGGGFAVLCLDLDRFKEVNDVYGHPAGDELLRAVAVRLRATVPPGAEVFRLGGDEFVVLSARPEPGRGDRLAEAIVAAMQPTFDVLGHEVAVGISVGVGLFPEHGGDPVELLMNADMALCRAKLDGKGRHRVFEAAMDEAQRERRSMEDRLRACVARGELRLEYQPQVDVATGRTIGYEALVRWHHPVHGLLGPDRFIPIAEECGAIFPIGEWVLREACGQAAGWRDGLVVAVNLSAAQFSQPNLVAMIHRILLETGLAPSRLELELTETVLARQQQRAIDALRRLKALGVRVALDDFGTGYSSMSYLHQFPFDRLKVDRSFVADITRNPRSGAIVEAVVQLGRSLKFQVVAEGIETGEQYAAMRERRCDVAQGFYIGRPSAMATTFEAARAAGPLAASAG